MRRSGDKIVLVAAYYFPPYADVSWVRTAKFCKYLPLYGWKPQVLTVDRRYYGNKITDAEPAEIADMEVKRIPYLPMPGAASLIKLLYPFLICVEAWRQRNVIDAVYMVGSPYHPFMMTSLITTGLGLPTVLDFRDSWSLAKDMGRGLPGWLRPVSRKVAGAIEQIGIQFASAVCFATDVLKEEYARFIPQHQGKYYTITNGYDPADFEGLAAKKLSTKKSLILSGKFHHYTPEVAEFLIGLLREYADLCLIYVGGEAKRIAAIAAAAGVTPQVISLDYMAYSEVLPLIAGADYGLVTNSMENGMGTKIFDYLALSKPVLCFVPQGSVICRQFQQSSSVVIRQAPHTEDSIRSGIDELLALGRAGSVLNMEGFSRKNCTASLARILDHITDIEVV